MIGKLLRIKVESDDNIKLYMDQVSGTGIRLRPGDVLCRLPNDEDIIYPAEIYVMSGVGCGWVRMDVTEDL